MTFSRRARLLVPAVVVAAAACGSVDPMVLVDAAAPVPVAGPATPGNVMTADHGVVTLRSARAAALDPATEPVVVPTAAASVAEESPPPVARAAPATSSATPSQGVQSIEITTYARVVASPSPRGRGVRPIPIPGPAPVPDDEPPLQAAAPLVWATDSTVLDAAADDVVAGLLAIYTARGYEVTTQHSLSGAGSSTDLYVVANGAVIGAVSVSVTPDGTLVHERWSR